MTSPATGDVVAPTPTPSSSNPTPMGSTGGAHQPAELPWWRRPRRISRQLAGALALTSFLAVVTFGALNYVAARDLLVRGTQAQLAAVGATRADSIDASTQRLTAEVSAAAADLGAAEALVGFVELFADLETRELTQVQRDELDGWYQDRLVNPLNDLGLGPFAVEDFVPATRAGQWVQYHYTVRSQGEPAPLDPGDGSDYTEANKRANDAFRAFSDSRGGGDVLLIDVDGTIVYSLEKRNDVGTNLVTGPYADSALASVVTEQLPTARIGTALLTDFAVTATGRPSLFAVSAVRSGTEVVGVLAVEIPVAALNTITGVSGDWDDVGLADGDSYIVAADLRLQSEPRAWIVDPDGYLERLRQGDETDQAEADLIEAFGSPVGIQVVDTEPVLAALDGEEFRGAASNHLGDSTFSAAESFRASGRQWVVVTEVPRATALDPLTSYVLRILVVLAVVLPIVAALGVWLSRLLTRPIGPTVDAAEAVVAGDRDPDIDTARGDEFGDVGRRLSAMAEALAAHEAELAEEYERTRQLLLSVLPQQLVDENGQVVGTGEAADQATVAAVTVAPVGHPDQEEASEALQRAAGLAEAIATEHGLQRVRVAADRYLFVGGMATDDHGADSALDFATRLQRALRADVEVELSLHVGLATGAVATGVFDSGTLTFGAWGDPVRRALALAALAEADAVLVDASTARAAEGGEHALVPASDIVDLDGQAMSLFTLDDAPSQPPAPPRAASAVDR